MRNIFKLIILILISLSFHISASVDLSRCTVLCGMNYGLGDWNDSIEKCYNWPNHNYWVEDITYFPSGHHRVDYKNYYCPQITCESPATWDRATLQCVTPPTNCSIDQTWDVDAQVCVNKCGDNQTFIEASLSCANNCPAGQRLNTVLLGTAWVTECVPDQDGFNPQDECPTGFTLVEGMCAQNADDPSQCPFGYDHISGICLMDGAECSGGELGIRVILNIETGESQCKPFSAASSSAPTSAPSSNSGTSASSPSSATPPTSSGNSGSSAGGNSGDGSGNGSGGDGGNDGNGGSNGSTPSNGSGSGSDSSGAPSSAGGGAAGGDCSRQPTCEGDAIQCALLNQIWRGQCAGTEKIQEIDADAALSEYDAAFADLTDEANNFHLVNEEGVLQLLTPEEIDVSKDDMFGLSKLNDAANSPSSGSCPSPRQLNVALGSFEISYQFFCDLAEQLSAFVVFLFAFISAKIIYRSLVEV